MVRRDMRLTGSLIGLLMAAAAIFQAVAYWPGIMTWDAIRQYGQAVDGDFDDWHPPAMEWLWRQFTVVHTGPAPMLVLQLLLYWAGFALLATAALKRGRRGLAAALATCALLPIALALMGSVLKDCLMAGALLSATGLFVWSQPDRDGPDRGWILRTLAVLLLLGAAVLRFNAFLAALPLLVALMPSRWRGSPARFVALSAAASLLLVAAMPIANRLVGAEHSGVELSLVIFDLGGITEHSGVDAFPPLGVTNPVAVNHRCYMPEKWDSYSFWVSPLCPINFDTMRAALAASGQTPYPLLVHAIVAHPLAYAEHRLTHFNINTRFLVHEDVDTPAPDRAVPNPWHYEVAANNALSAINYMAVVSACTPLGWPIWWLAVALGVVALCPRLPSRAIILPIALSALLYGLGYLVFSVASELRYHLWTMLGTLIAVVFVANDIAKGADISGRRMLAASLPAIVVTICCLLWRGV